MFVLIKQNYIHKRKSREIEAPELLCISSIVIRHRNKYDKNHQCADFCLEIDFNCVLIADALPLSPRVDKNIFTPENLTIVFYFRFFKTLFYFLIQNAKTKVKYVGFQTVMNLVPFLNLYSFCLFCPVVSFCHSPICIISETWLTDRS